MQRLNRSDLSNRCINIAPQCVVDITVERLSRGDPEKSGLRTDEIFEPSCRL